MRQAAFAAALAAALVHGGAQGATYVATLSGSGVHQTQTNTPITWTGQVTVVTDGTADGTYTGATLESITVDTDIYDWRFTKGQTQVLTEPVPGVFLLVGPEPGASVSLAGGRLSGIDLAFDDESNIDTMSGLTVSSVTLCRSGACHGVPDNYMVSGTLTPLAGTVPEPPAPWLLLGGLGLAAAGLRRRDA